MMRARRPEQLVSHTRQFFLFCPLFRSFIRCYYLILLLFLPSICFSQAESRAGFVLCSTFYYYVQRRVAYLYILSDGCLATFYSTILWEARRVGYGKYEVRYVYKTLKVVRRLYKTDYVFNIQPTQLSYCFSYCFRLFLI